MSNTIFRTHLSRPERIHDNQVQINDNLNSRIHATVRGGTDIMNPIFQSIPADSTGNVIQFGVVVEDPFFIWDSVNYRFIIPETGSYNLMYGLCARDELTGTISNENSQIFEYGATFRIYNPDGVTIREDFGKQTSNGGIGATINTVFNDIKTYLNTSLQPYLLGNVPPLVGIPPLYTTSDSSNTIDVNTVNSGVILPLNAGEQVELVSLVNTAATPTMGILVLDLVDPAFSPAPGTSVASSWMSIMKI